MISCGLAAPAGIDMVLVLIVGGTLVVVLALIGATGYLIETSADKHEESSTHP
jgi:hypothetical protein